MIGWALRWLIFGCGLAVLWAAIVNSGRWPPTADSFRLKPVVGAATTELPPAGVNRLVYPADTRGHVVLDAAVDGAPVRFLVDTGASLVTLTAGDARAAGLDPSRLAFNERATTANGEVRIATLTLRQIRLGQLEITDVPAAVVERLKVSLLGMSFLSRLRSYEMREGKLTITW